MKKKFDLDFFDSQYPWVLLFGLTFVGSYYWLPNKIPLFYSHVLPEEKLADKHYLLILPLLVLIFFILSKTFLERLALNNNNMLKLLRIFRIGLASFCFILFIRIILLVI